MKQDRFLSTIPIAIPEEIEPGRRRLYIANQMAELQNRYSNCILQPFVEYTKPDSRK